MRKLAIVAALSLVPLSDVKAEDIYGYVLEPGYYESEDEAIFSTIDTFGFRDSYHYDRATGSLTVVGGDGYISVEPVSEAAWVPCVAGPVAVAACVVIGGAGYFACNSAQRNSIRRVQKQCAAAGLVAEISNTGVCGQNMESRCLEEVTDRWHRQEP